MKKNLDEARKLLETALSKLPADSYRLGNLRLQIRRAINETYSLEKKESKQTVKENTPQDRWQLDLASGVLMSPQQHKTAISSIDKMIKEQQKILDSLT